MFKTQKPLQMKNPAIVIRPIMILVLFFLFTGCENPTKAPKDPPFMDLDAFSSPQPVVGLFVLSLEKAHNATEYRKRENVRFEITANIADMENHRATITMSTTAHDVKIETEDAPSFVYEESRSSFVEDSIMHNFKRLRSFAWAHFFSLPKRLRNHDVRVEKFKGTNQLGGESYKVRAIRLEPKPGFDNLFEWYVVYVDRNTGLLRYAAYALPEQMNLSENVVSHAVEYSDYRNIEGIPIAHTWTFWEWSPESGLGKKLGNAKLENVDFLFVDDGYYQ